MERRIFLKQAAITAAAVACTGKNRASASTPANPIARRTLGRTGEKLRRDCGDERRSRRGL